MSIRLKDADGRIGTIAPAAFRRLFGVSYTDKLIAPASLPAAYLTPAYEVGRRTAEELGPRQIRAYRRRISAGYTASVYVAKVSDEVGHGLFAYRDLRPGAMIGECTGTLTRDWVAEVRKPSDINPYLLRYPFECAFAIDAQKKGNVTRFLNHSEAKANVRRVYVFQGGLLHGVFAADKPIKKDTQLFLDYGANYWHGRKPLEIEG